MHTNVEILEKLINSLLDIVVITDSAVDTQQESGGIRYHG